MTAGSATRLGQLLVETGLVTAPALAEVLEAQQNDRRRLGEILTERGLVTPQQLAQMLSHQLACPWISLANVVIAPSLLGLIPAELATRHVAIPVYVRTVGAERVLYVAMDDPTDEEALTALSTAAGMRTRGMVAATSELRGALAAFYSGVAEPQPPAPPGPTPPQQAVAPPARLPLGARPIPVPRNVSDALYTADDAANLSAMPVVPPSRGMRPVVLVVHAGEPFIVQCRSAAHEVGAQVEVADLMMVSGRAAANPPFAIVVTDDVYGIDRQGLNGLAIECDALLVVWSEDLEATQLRPLLASALARRPR